MRAALMTTTQQAGCNLRQRRLGCRRVGVALLYTDGVTVTRQAVAPLPVCDDPGLLQLACTALYRAWYRRVRLRQLTLTCSLLQHPVQQLSLFAAADLRPQKNRQLSEAVDAIRNRCGSHAILRGGQQSLTHEGVASP